MTRMPCSITDGPASEMDAIEEAQEPQEREYDKHLDSEDIKVAFERSVSDSLLDAIEDMHQGLDRMALQIRKQGE